MGWNHQPALHGHLTWEQCVHHVTLCTIVYSISSASMLALYVCKTKMQDEGYSHVKSYFTQNWSVESCRRFTFPSSVVIAIKKVEPCEGVCMFSTIYIYMYIYINQIIILSSKNWRVVNCSPSNQAAFQVSWDGTRSSLCVAQICSNNGYLPATRMGTDPLLKDCCEGEFTCWFFKTIHIF